MVQLGPCFPAGIIPKQSYIRECQEKHLPLGSVPRHFSLGIQPNWLGVHPHSASGLPQASYSFRRGKRRNASSPLWLHSLLRQRHSFSETTKPDSYPLEEWQRMVLFETRGLWLSWIVRGGIGCPGRLACFKARIGLTASVDTSPRIRASQELDGHNQEWFPGKERTLCQRRSSCLLFQMFGVETYLLLPDDQGDRGNLPRQGKTRHRWLAPFGKQGFVEIVERSSTAAGF
jgi:hypothetical protein